MPIDFRLSMKQRRPSPTMVYRKAVLTRMEALIGDDAAPGSRTPWRNVLEELGKMRAPYIASIVERIEKRLGVPSELPARGETP